MFVEKRIDGAQIMRPGTGRQRLLTATTHQAEVVIVCSYGEVVSVVRHYDESLRKTVPCECTGPCYSQRTDRFLGVLYRVGPTLWEERLMVLPASAWASLVGTSIQHDLDHEKLEGLRCILGRKGDPVNGRTWCSVQERVRGSVPKGFDMLAAVRNCVGVAADFFGDADGEIIAGQIIPARSREDKPRLPLGRPQRG